MSAIAAGCPHCGERMEVPPKLAGKQLLCARCLAPFVVPALAAFIPVRPAPVDRAAAATLRPDDPAPAPRAEADTVAAAADTDRAPLGRVGRFELRRFLGQGAYGKVYLAHDPQLERDVALKMPRVPPADPAEGERFLREGKAASRLRHPGIVAVYEAGRAGDTVYLASEYVAGVPLSVRLREDPPAPYEAGRIVRDLARAMQYAHAQGVVHRDLKPANVLIDPSGAPRVTDFGLARRVDETHAGDGGPVGTPAYMAPEQARGRVTGPAADVYALGAVLYELLTGRAPFQGAPHEVVAAVAGGARPPAPRQLKSVPKDVDAVCRKAMGPKPADRYKSAGDLAEDLDRWLGGYPVEARPVPAVERVFRRTQLRWLVAAVVVPVVLAGVAIFVDVFGEAFGTTRGQLYGNDAIAPVSDGLRRGARDAAEWSGRNPAAAAVAAMAVLVPLAVGVFGLTLAAGYRRAYQTARRAAREHEKRLAARDRLTAELSADGRTLTTTAADGTVTVWTPAPTTPPARVHP